MLSSRHERGSEPRNCYSKGTVDMAVPVACCNYVSSGDVSGVIAI